jgi:hypothetical protein
MKITKHQLRSIVREEIAHPRDNLGINTVDAEFPMVVGYEGKSEIAYHQEELDDILDDIAPRGIKYSLNSLNDIEPRDRPSGAEIEQFGENMKITKRQLKILIREEKIRILHEQPISGEQAEQMQRDQDLHSWPRIEWDSSIGELTDKWMEMEEKAFDPKDPSMTNDGELSTADAKKWWADQIDAAALDLENDLTVEVRKVALKAMKDITDRLINGDYA